MTHHATQPTAPANAPAHAGIYRYDAVDRQFVAERVAQFRDQVQRRLAGVLSEDEFKPLRLMNGLYLQLHAYMLRVAIPYGTLTGQQLRALAEIGRRYDKGYGHFTTRQNLQFNWIRLEDTPDILDALGAVDMHAIQTSGNCIRNVTTDQFAGVAADAVADPRVYAEILRQWSTLHPEFTFLPRKFKIAIIAGDNDRAVIRAHDVGVKVKTDAAGAIGFEVYVGGGLGRSPFLGQKTRDWVDEQDLIAYLEAVLRVYNRLGRRDNIYKARIKILLHQTGLAKFTEMVEEEFAALRGPRYHLDPEIVAEIRRHFAAPPYDDLAETPVNAVPGTAFARWLETNVAAHRQPGYAAVTVSLKPAGGIPGDATSDQMDVVADLADRFSFGEVRVTHTQNLVLPHVRRADLAEVFAALDAAGLGAANVGTIADIIACPGLDYCSLANARAIPLAQELSRRFADPERQKAIGDVSIKMSGCINACGHHHVASIGVLGVDKHGKEAYQLTLGGDPTLNAAIGDLLGPAMTEEETADAVEKVVDLYLARREPGERFNDTLARLGRAAFKETVYAAG